MSRKFFALSLVLVVGFSFLFYAAPCAAQATSATMTNLMKAFDGESNANARYLAFAKKADEEGYGQVASLFRAAAKAEEIHLKSHAKVIEKMGGTAKADIKTPEVKSTKENLQAAITGESYERDTMYPEFIAAAEKDKAPDAVATFTAALKVEGGHAKLYTEAAANIEKWKQGAKEFFVCPKCGNTIPAPVGFAVCPICQTPKGKFLKVS